MELNENEVKKDPELVGILSWIIKKTRKNELITKKKILEKRRGQDIYNSKDG